MVRQPRICKCCFQDKWKQMQKPAPVLGQLRVNQLQLNFITVAWLTVRAKYSISTVPEH